jgi:pyruvate kinase
MRRAKILATLGPASDGEAVIRALIAAGANAFRLNFSHGSREDHERRVEIVRRVSAELGRPVAIVQDLPGPKLRTGHFPGGPVTLKAGDEVVLTGREVEGTATLIHVSYPYLGADIPIGSRILMDDGRIEVRAVAAEGEDLRCQVVNGGILSDRKGVNFPDVPLRLPAVTDDDRVNLAFGLGLEVDYVALSFVRRAADVREARELIAARGCSTPLIAKIEKPQALDDLDDILEASDGVMVARGDLGVEMPPERVPILQKQIIEQANACGKLVIVATQMLESMMHEPRPTRAEASDVANAVIDGTDVVMLSGETAVGEYPVETVAMMGRIVEEAERSGRHGDLGVHTALQGAAPTYAHAISHAAREIAHDMELKAIVAFSQSGFTARLIAKDRPGVPILAVTPMEAVYRQMALLWGVTPVQCPFAKDTDGMIHLVERELVVQGHLAAGDLVVIMGGMPVAARGKTNFIKIHRVEKSTGNE